MDAQLLQRFVTVVEAGSLNKAAKQLRVSQPSLTRSIQLLEEYYAVELLRRTSRGIVPTAFGQAVFRRAKLVQAELRHLQSEIDGLRELTVGEINVGLPAGIGFNSRVLPAATLPLVSGKSKLVINYVIGTREKLLPLLRQGDLDFAITSIANDEFADELVQEELYAERGAIIVRKGHPLSRQARVSLAQIGKYPWAVLSDSPHLERNLRNIAFTGNFSFSRGFMRCQSSLLIKSALLDSDLVGFLSHDAVRVEVDNGLLCELTLDSPGQARDLLSAHLIGVVYRRDAALSSASLALIGNIRQECVRRHYTVSPSPRKRRAGNPKRLFSFVNRVAKA
jgi:DNA-binding transcriptional LysR family regulator